MIYSHLFFCRLLDRDHVDAEEVTVDDEEENDFFKAFKVFLASLCFSHSLFTSVERVMIT